MGKLVLRGDGLFVQGLGVRAASPAHVGAGARVTAAHAGLGEGFAGRVARLTEGFVGGWVFRLDEIDLYTRVRGGNVTYSFLFLDVYCEFEFSGEGSP